MRALTARVDARVGPARPYNLARQPRYRGESSFQKALYGARMRLGLPPAVCGAVIFDTKEIAPVHAAFASHWPVRAIM